VAVAHAAVATLPAIAGLTSPAPRKKVQKTRKPTSPVKKPAAATEAPLPPGRDGDVTALVRKVVRQIVAGKLDYSLISPALKSRLTPAKVNSMGSELRAYGPLKAVTFIDRTPKETVDACTFKAALRDASFIVTASVSKENRLEELSFIEE
jgi:hypothetical protein